MTAVSDSSYATYSFPGELPEVQTRTARLSDITRASKKGIGGWSRSGSPERTKVERFNALFDGQSTMISKDKESEHFAGSTKVAKVCLSPLSQHKDLSNIGLLEFFDLDERPIIILDFEDAERPSVAYTNPRLGELGLCERNGGKSGYLQTYAENDHECFLEWITRVSDNPQTATLLYNGVKWTTRTLRNRWRVVTGNVGAEVKEQIVVAHEPPKEMGKFEKMPPTPKTEQLLPYTASQLDLESHTTQRDTGILTPPAQDSLAFGENSEGESPGVFMRDIFDPLAKSNLSPHICFFLDYDWAATELGPISSWPGEIRRMCNILMVDPRPAAICCGAGKITMYNEAYMPLVGEKHPGAMGRSLFKVWEEHKDSLEPLLDQALSSGKPVLTDDTKANLVRQGYQEELYFSMTVIPYNTGSIPNRALYCSIFDTTRKVIAQRRMALLLRLGQELAISRNRQGFWDHLLRGLEPDDPDITYALLYSAGRDDQAALSTSVEHSHQPHEWILEGSVRVPNSDVNVPKNIRPGPEMDSFLSDFDELLRSESPTILSKNDGTMPYRLATAIGDTLSSATAAFLPIRSTCTNIAGFLIIGLVSQRSYDDDYRLFVQLLSRQLATSMAAAVLIEDEVQRGRKAAEQAVRDRDRLSEALEIQAREAVELDIRFRRMADLAPVGMFHMDANGGMVYANNYYYTLTKQPKDEKEPMCWRKVIHDDDGPILDVEWAKLMRGESSASELRLKDTFKPDENFGEEGLGDYSWILTAAYPETTEDGTIVGVYGCLTDISKQKWTEGFQKRKMLEAIELKRQQENFIDMTSHEMRNPLSAIVQCADMIGTSIADFGGEEDGDALVPREIINSFADAASTIAFCAQHQKRIIDDILTLSKLDSDLFYITPVEVRPLDVVNNALKMFDGELQNNDISLDVHIDSSFNDLNVDWLKFDPSRMLQVLINLITNAIKFTHTEQIRKISITASASLKAPSSDSDIVYLERTNSRKQNTQENEWGDGEIVYLNVKVQDSGRGLDEHEQSLLFQRFSQASPRTHVQYGGSGLGLFISRELTELQGGQIGLSSVAGEGSTFAFYILARRCNAPDVPNATIIKPESRDENKVNPVPRGHSPARQPSITHRSHAPNGPRKSLTMTSLIHVLIVEDNIINQKVLTKQLLHVGCIVHVANHGLEALNFLEKSTVSNTLPPNEEGIRCDIVLMDLEMPIMNGLTCIKEIRMREEDKRIKGRVPIIALTANARREQIEKAREAGVDSVVTKPFRIRELVPELKRWVGVGGKRTGCAGECAGGGSPREDVRVRNRIVVEKKTERRQFDRRSTGPV